MSENSYKYFLWFVIAVILIFSPIPKGSVGIGFNLPIIATIVFFLFTWLWRVNNCPGYNFRHTALDIPIFAFVVLAAISFIFSVYKQDSFYAFLKLFAYVGLFYLIVNNFDYVMMRQMLLLVICIGGTLSIFGLLQYFDVLPHSWWKPERFLASTYVNHNHFSGYLELVIPVALAVFLKKGQIFFVRAISAIALMIMIVAFVLAQSRGAWICLLISMFIMGVHLLKMRNFARISICIMFLLVLFIFSFIYFTRPEVSQRLDTIAGMEIEEASWQVRLKIWRGNIEMIKQNPLIGTGIGTFGWVFPRFRPEGVYGRAQRAHNEYLHMAAEMGVLAPLIMIGILLIVIRKGMLHGKVSLDILGCTTGILSLSLHGLIDFNFHIPANMLLCATYIGFIMRKNEMKNSLFNF